MIYKASFHNHTKYSDGSFQLEDLLDEVGEINRKFKREHDSMIKGVAIVDHDFYPDAPTMQVCRDHASKHAIELLFGTEISADNDSVHIVGYEVDPTDFSFLRHVIKEQYKRLDAFEATCRKLNHFFAREGKSIDLDTDVGSKTAKRDKQDHIIGHGPLRWHYLREAMVERGMARDTKEANVLIGPVGPCYHQRETIDSVMAVEMVLKWGGKPVLAHPHKIPGTYRDRVIHSLIEAGLAGIEAYTKDYSEPEATNMYVKIARDHQLLVLAGTDLHRDYQDVGNFLLPYTVFEALRDYRATKAQE